MRVCGLTTIGLLLLLSGCVRGHEYELRGQVLAVDPVRQELTIKHGDIRGFMPGMTMPFKVHDTKLLAGRTAGDLVIATLVVRDDAAYLSAVTTTGHSALTEPPPVRTMDVLEDGAPVPDVRLIDDSGATRSLSDWRGRVLAVTFVYTRCPLPDFCVRMDRNFAAAQRAIVADSTLRDRSALLSISFDPQNDTPAVLADHARDVGADARVWRFATGEADAVTTFARRFGVSVFREGTEAEGLTHNLRTAVIKPDGTLSAILNGNDWTVTALLDAMRHAGK